MNKTITPTLTVLSGILLLLLLIVLGKSLMFRAVQKNWVENTSSDFARVTFYWPDGHMDLPDQQAKNLASSHFNAGTYAVRAHVCYLRADTGGETRYYWWFLNPLNGRIVLLPAPSLFGKPLSATMVYPGLLVWYTEKNSRLYQRIRQHLGTDKNLQTAVNSCIVRPAVFFY